MLARWTKSSAVTGPMLHANYEEIKLQTAVGLAKLGQVA